MNSSNIRAVAFAGLACLAGLAGCGGSGGLTYKLEPAQVGVPPQPKDPACDFKVTSEGPTDGSYDKLGTLTPTDFAATSKDDLKGAIRAQVCQLGGEIVIATQNELGNYATAIVLRKHLTDAPSGPGAAPAGAPGPAPSPAPAP